MTQVNQRYFCFEDIQNYWKACKRRNSRVNSEWKLLLGGSNHRVFPSCPVFHCMLGFYHHNTLKVQFLFASAVHASLIPWLQLPCNQQLIILLSTNLYETHWLPDSCFQLLHKFISSSTLPTRSLLQRFKLRFCFSPFFLLASYTWNCLSSHCIILLAFPPLKLHPTFHSQAKAKNPSMFKKNCYQLQILALLIDNLLFVKQEKSWTERSGLLTTIFSYNNGY